MKRDITRLKQKIDEVAQEAMRHGWELTRVDMRRMPHLNEGDSYALNIKVNIDDPQYEAAE